MSSFRAAYCADTNQLRPPARVDPEWDARILVVDADAPRATATCRLLAADGFTEIVVIGDAPRALEHARDERPDLVIIDPALPRIDPLGVVRDLRQLRPDDSRWPILVLCDDSSHKTQLTALMMGANDFVTRPFHPSEFLLRVRRHLRVQQAFRDLDGRCAELASVAIVARHDSLVAT